MNMIRINHQKRLCEVHVCEVQLSVEAFGNLCMTQVLIAKINQIN